MELGEHQSKWVEALESGRYKQGRFSLRTDNKYCALGVACDVSGIADWESTGSGRYAYLGAPICLPPLVEEWLGLRGADVYSMIATMNDIDMTFDDIADYIRLSHEKLFCVRK